MCGIFGYVGGRPASPLVLDGLARLEYRGYDSAGIAVVSDGGLEVRRTVGRVRSLVAEQGADALPGQMGIGHTRWATHGRPSVENAHPHTDCRGVVAVVHNGIIENHGELREQLVSRGHRFWSETDTEVVAHLVEECWGGELETTIRKVAEQLHGDFALAILHRDAPGSLAAVRSGNPPLLVGLGEAEHFLGSDSIALAPHTQTVLPLGDGDVAILTGARVDVTTLHGGPPTPRSPIRLQMSPEEVERGGHPHFMHKEIYEQPSGIRQALRARVRPGALVRPFANGTAGPAWAGVRRVTLVACGTSYHAALLGRWYFESLARIPADADISSEFRYRDLPADPGDLAVFVSQSGETADTLGALQVAREGGRRIVGICNVPGSSLTREADDVVMTSTGPEIGVASTKTFSAQVVALLLMALDAGQARGTVPPDLAKALLNDLAALPSRIEAALQQQDGHVASLADRFGSHRDFFFLGRGASYPIALEGALKLKEIAYVRAEAFPAGEMKHGPLALIDPGTVTIALAPAGRTRTRMLTTIEEVRARGGSVIEVCTEIDKTEARLVDATLRVPAASEYVMPCLLTIPLQLFAYHGAVIRGCDVDRPRNLAKSVTVE